MFESPSLTLEIFHRRFPPKLFPARNSQPAIRNSLGAVSFQHPVLDGQGEHELVAVRGRVRDMVFDARESIGAFKEEIPRELVTNPRVDREDLAVDLTDPDAGLGRFVVEVLAREGSAQLVGESMACAESDRGAIRRTC